MIYTSVHESLSQRCAKGVPASPTMAQHWHNFGLLCVVLGVMTWLSGYRDDTYAYRGGDAIDRKEGMSR